MVNKERMDCAKLLQLYVKGHVKITEDDLFKLCRVIKPPMYTVNEMVRIAKIMNKEIINEL